jgi:hypothetical protein
MTVLRFNPDGQVTVDMSNDGQNNVTAEFNVEDNIIIHQDQEGKMCRDDATYKLYNT